MPPGYLIIHHESCFTGGLDHRFSRAGRHQRAERRYQYYLPPTAVLPVKPVIALTPNHSQSRGVRVDTQIVELIGRHHLTAELLRAGLEVATPVRDRGIDLIAYADIDKRLTK